VRGIERSKRKRILDFDIETRRVGFFGGGPFSPDGCEPVAIGCSWVGENRVYSWTLGDTPAKRMLERFRELYDEAYVVTGHYARKFDLPILCGAMLENGFPPLSAKLVSDTHADLRRRAGLSASQENLGELLGLAESKYHMNDQRWRQAARLTPVGLKQAKRRVVMDVRQHKALRAALIDAGWLKQPRMWTP
jgi:hypothetical protein